MIIQAGLTPVKTWGENKVFSKVLYAVAKKNFKESCTLNKAFINDYEATKNLIDRYIKLEASRIYPAFKLFYWLVGRIKTVFNVIVLKYFRKFIT